jgi:ATP-dependent RNA helicase DeaD
MHGDMTQAMRERTIGKFRKHAIEFLVATDVAARGLDVEDIEVVFNYDLPHDGDDYIHRIGRTGRAGRSGRAVTFVSGRELYKMQNIIRFTKGKIRREQVPSEEEVEEKRANLFYDTLRQTLEGGKYERQDALISRLLDQGFVATDIASALLHMFTVEANAAPARPEPSAAGAPRRQERDFAPQRASHDRPSHDRPSRDRPSHDRPSQDRPSRQSHDRDIEARYPQSEGTGRKVDRTSGQVSHEPGMTRLTLGVGREHDVQPGDVLGVIVGMTKLPKDAVGVIRLQTKQTFVDVAEDQADFIVSKLNGITFKGRKLWCKRAGAKPVSGEAASPSA